MIGTKYDLLKWIFITLHTKVQRLCNIRQEISGVIKPYSTFKIKVLQKRYRAFRWQYLSLHQSE